MTVLRRGDVWGSVNACDFRTATRSGGVFTLPSWLSIACATTGRSVQTSASTLISGLGANAARARSVDGSTWGLSVEKAITQQVPRTDLTAAAWVASNGATITSATDPTGASTSCSVNDTSGTLVSQLVQTITTTAGTASISVWMKILAPTPTRCDVQTNTGAGDFLIAGTVDAAWVRRDLTGTTTAAAHNSVIAPRNVTASETGSVLVYGYQIESGKYPTSVFLNTSGASATKAADVLSIPTPSGVAPGGFFDLALIVAPNYANTEQGVDHNLFYLDANNRVFIQQSTSKVVLRIGGVDVLSSALTWSRNQALTIRAQHRPTGRFLDVSGATTGNGSATGTASAAVSLPATAYMLGSNTGAEECADLQYVRFGKAQLSRKTK